MQGLHFNDQREIEKYKKDILEGMPNTGAERAAMKDFGGYDKIVDRITDNRYFRAAIRCRAYDMQYRYEYGYDTYGDTDRSANACAGILSQMALMLSCIEEDCLIALRVCAEAKCEKGDTNEQ